MFKYCLGLCFLVMSSFSFAESQTWYFVRHFEKQKSDNPSLTETGKARAEALASFFSNKPLKQVYSTDYNRTLETATPVAALKKLPVENYDPRNLVEFATKLKSLDHVLVVGHSNTTPELLSLMGGASISIKESEFGIMYIVKKKDLDISSTSIHITLK